MLHLVFCDHVANERLVNHTNWTDHVLQHRNRLLRFVIQSIRGKLEMISLSSLAPVSLRFLSGPHPCPVSCMPVLFYFFPPLLSKETKRSSLLEFSTRLLVLSEYITPLLQTSSSRRWQPSPKNTRSILVELYNHPARWAGSNSSNNTMRVSQKHGKYHWRTQGFSISDTFARFRVLCQH